MVKPLKLAEGVVVDAVAFAILAVANPNTATMAQNAITIILFLKHIYIFLFFIFPALKSTFRGATYFVNAIILYDIFR
jgi:hypothetical protein